MYRWYIGRPSADGARACRQDVSVLHVLEEGSVGNGSLVGICRKREL